MLFLKPIQHYWVCISENLTSILYCKDDPVFLTGLLLSIEFHCQTSYSSKLKKPWRCLRNKFHTYKNVGHIKNQCISSDFLLAQKAFTVLFTLTQKHLFGSKRLKKNWITVATTQMQISRQNWNGFFSNISHQMMI